MFDQSNNLSVFSLLPFFFQFHIRYQVNNCIGRRNYRFFFFFLISLSIHMMSTFSLCLFYVLHHKKQLAEPASIVAYPFQTNRNRNFRWKNHFLAEFGNNNIKLRNTIFWNFFCHIFTNSSLTAKIISILVNSIVLIAIVIVLAIPIFGLTGFHMVLVSRGRTTNEQVTGKFKGGYNPFSRGCWHNCCYTQFGPQYPRSVITKRNISIFSKTNPHQYLTTCVRGCLIYTVWWSHRNMRRVGQRRKIKQLARLRMKNKGIRAIMPFNILVFMKSTNRPKWKRIRIMGMAMANVQEEQHIIARLDIFSLISQQMGTS